ncbi:MAG: hypothetical protein BRC47_10940 [Cyanobacteria bacterium QS_7_48_42]|nr:MAG: hypothetical protein BRC48_09935 [Cyanobacteria bacterium QS_9_48_30]PSP00804.1 MAG: hypothetical protein BRC47_10940 [Cyanobacteria bacterium QS_7_48_42]
MQALEIEHRAYRDLYDERLLSREVLNKLSLMIEMKRDAVLANRIPPQLPTVKELETRWENFFARVRRRFARGSKRQSQQTHSLILQYEYESALAYVCHKVVRKMHHLIQERAVEVTVAFDSIYFYEDRSRASLEKLKAIIQYYPDLTATLQQRVAMHAALISEQEVVERLAADGVCPAGASSKVRKLIEAKLNQI